FRRTFEAELQRRAILRDIWHRARIKEAANPALKSAEWKSISELARERGANPIDLFFDLAIQDDLNLVYMMPLLDINEERVVRKFSDPRTMIGISDGGAHVDMLCNAGYPTYLLGYFARDKQAITLEHAIKRITSEPAGFFGMSDRGKLQPGMAADITIFDYDRIGSPERPEIRHDFPGGGRRLVTQADGIEYTIINGTVLYESRRHTGTLPGRVLRSGQPMA
ncbi:MAG: amidohydrolase family protein, partial [Deltaproteobacteria bacterium]|nr:amidohydrolase family protein [Deltaproteobacteria bacterium]